MSEELKIEPINGAVPKYISKEMEVEWQRYCETAFPNVGENQRHVMRDCYFAGFVTMSGIITELHGKSEEESAQQMSSLADEANAHIRNLRMRYAQKAN